METGAAKIIPPPPKRDALAIVEDFLEEGRRAYADKPPARGTTFFLHIYAPLDRYPAPFGGAGGGAQGSAVPLPQPDRKGQKSELDLC